MAVLNYGKVTTEFPEGDQGQLAGKSLATAWIRGRLAKTLAGLAVLIGLVSAPHRSARGQEPTEYQVKAAFLYNFAKFVDWPVKAFPHISAPAVLCLLGDDPFGPDLERTVNGKTVNNRKLAIRRLKSLQGADSCHILFISSSETPRLSQILRALRTLPVLTVGEIEGFAHLGGIINFIEAENKVRFEINLESAERAGLKISSRLLKVARTVSGGKN